MGTMEPGAARGATGNPDEGEERVDSDQITERIDDAQDQFTGDRKDRFGGETSEEFDEDQR